VISVTFGAAFLAGTMAPATLLVLMASNYAFKATVALADTIPLYFLVGLLRGYLQIDNEHTF
jgi:queuosine precursor transporter